MKKQIKIACEILAEKLDAPCCVFKDIFPFCKCYTNRHGETDCDEFSEDCWEHYLEYTSKEECQ